MLAAVSLTACTEPQPSQPERGGTVVIATTSDADILFPPLVQRTTARQVTELIYDYLTEVSPSLNTVDDRTFARRLAKSWDWSNDSMSLAVHLEPGARWHDGQPVRSDDVTYSYHAYTDTALGSPMKSQLAAIDSVTASDSLTAVFWFNKRYPLQFYDATSQMQILPRHVFASVPPDSIRAFVAATRPVGSGRYRFVSWKPGESIELAADTVNYRGAPKINRLIWRIMPSVTSATKALFAGEADIYDAMRPEDVAQAAADSSVKVLVSPGADYAFLAFNLKEPKQSTKGNRLFASRELRRALSMAVDRDAMVRNVFDSLALAGIGPTIRAFPSTDSLLRQLPYDTVRAAQILDSLGWRIDPRTKVRAKNGQQLRFSVLVPSSSLNRMRMGVLLQEQLRKIGVAVDLDQMDFSSLATRIGNRDFDAALWSWHLGTNAAAIREIWTGEAATMDGNNFGSYVNPVFDAYVDSAVSTFDPSKTKAYYTRAYETVIEDAPAIWLYDPKMVLGIHRRLRSGPMRPD